MATADEDLIDPDEALPDGVTDKPREVLVSLIHDYDGRANTRDLREETGIPSIPHHGDTLVSAGLVERAGKEQAGRGSPATVWEATDDGVHCAEEWAEPVERMDREQMAEEIRDLKEAREQDAAKRQELANQVEELEERLGEKAEASRVEEIANAFNGFKDAVGDRLVQAEREIGLTEQSSGGGED